MCVNTSAFICVIWAHKKRFAVTLCDSICNSDVEINSEELQIVTSLISIAQCDADMGPYDT